MVIVTLTKGLVQDEEKVKAALEAKGCLVLVVTTSEAVRVIETTPSPS